MHLIDFLIVFAVFLLLIGIGWRLSHTGASKNTSEFMVAGRKMPWWLISLSDVAVGLNTSGMLSDSRKIRQDGIMGMWFSWAFLLKGCVAAVFFDRLWRRAGFKTQMEFYRCRYSGWRADFARIYDTIIYGGFVSCIWAGVGLVGVKKIATVMLDLPETLPLVGFSISTEVLVVLVVVGIAIGYSAVSGAKGVYWTDFVEFIIAISAIYVLLYLVLRDVGWSNGLRHRIDTMGDDSWRFTHFMQPFTFVYLWYFLTNPFLDHGGFNPGMQRTLSLKDEREAIYTMVAKGVIGNVIRQMPFMAIGIAGYFLVTDAFLMESFDPIFTPEGVAIPDYENVFPVLVDRYLPVGLTGLMIAGFFSAFMSSFDSNIHLSGSLLVNDFYKPYLAPGRTEKHYVHATQLVMVGASCLTVFVGIVSYDIFYLAAFAVTISLGAGWIKLLRIIWWRANGVGEVTAQVYSICAAAFILSPWGKAVLVDIMAAFGYAGNDQFLILRNLLLIGSSTCLSLIAVLMSPPEPMEKLCSFYRRMRPFGFWGPVRALCPEVQKPEPLSVQFALVFSMIAILWGAVFASFALLLALWTMAAVCAVVICIGIVGTQYFIRRLYPVGWKAEEIDYDAMEC